jgi:hypothetical protein
MFKVHTLYSITFAILIGMYLFLGLIAVWLFWPYPTIVFSDIPESGAKVLNSPLYPGDVLKYNISFCKNTNDTATVHRTLVDGQYLTLVDIVGSLPKRCGKNIVVTSTTIPETAVPGRYYLQIVDEFHPNPIRTITTGYKTEYFDVIARPVKYKVLIDGAPAVIKVISATSTKQ